jgi:hypothetical protein
MTLEDYLPEGPTYDEGIPKPASVLGFEVGDWHVRHDQLVSYLEILAETSDRIRIERTGQTHEGRPLLLLTVSSPANLASIEEIRDRREAGSGEGPLVVWQGFSVHGNEASGANASLVLAYYLAAAQSPEIDTLLDETVILIDPCLNPDGLGRFAQWANTHKAQTPDPDPVNRVHHEVWPNGRTNHYWFDLNRDWLLLVHPESRARVAMFHRWRPHVLTDFHEMGSDATFFFQPGVPSRRNPLTPERNKQLTEKIASYHAAALDRFDQLYITEEIFDDFYFGKGSTYPDINGAIGILFEQASSRGQLVETVHGELDFATTIRNQFVTSLSTMRAASALADDLHAYQRDFYERALEQARQDPVKAWLIGDGGDPWRTFHLVDLLRRHRIEVHELAGEIVVGEMRFVPGNAWVVPTEQRQYLLLKTLMERRTAFDDSTFYDVSTWTLPLSFNLPYAELDRRQLSTAAGGIVEAPTPPAGRFAPADDPYAFAFEWTGYYAPRALQRLLAEEIRVYAATKPFAADTPDGKRSFARGTIVVPVGTQGEKRDAVEPILREIAARDGVDVHVFDSGLTPDGIDLGSPSLRRLKPVKPLIVVGPGVRGYEVGEVWHLFDTRVGLPLSMVDIHRLDGVDFSNYTHLILVGGKYEKTLSDKHAERVRAWVETGGILVATKGGAKWVTDQKLHLQKKDETEDEDEEESKEEEEETDGDAEEEERFRPYAEYRNDRSKRRISGAIFEIHLDATHPIGYGYTGETLPVFRNGTHFFEPSENPYETVGRYTGDPLLSGYIGDERLEEIRGSAAIVAGRVGKGVVIRMADDPAFRGIWYGTNRLLLNAIYQAQTIDPTKLD